MYKNRITVFIVVVFLFLDILTLYMERNILIQKKELLKSKWKTRKTIELK